MKLTDYCARLSVVLDQPMSEFTELRRALAEQSSHFVADEDDLPNLDGTLLKARPGPGGGLEVTPFVGTFVCLALMVGGPRRDTALRTWKAWHLDHEGSVKAAWRGEAEPSVKKCPMTKQHLFGDALRSIFSDHGLAARVDRVMVGTNRTAEIHYDKTKVSRFDKGRRSLRSPLHTVSVLDGTAVRGIATLLAEG